MSFFNVGNWVIESRREGGHVHFGGSASATKSAPAGTPDDFSVHVTFLTTVTRVVDVDMTILYLFMTFSSVDM